MKPSRQSHILLHSHRRPSPGESLLVTIGTDLVRADGILDELTVDLLLATADFLFTRGSRTVTLDLTRTRRIDSDAVRELFHAQLNTDTGQELRFIVPAHLRPRLAICCLDDSADTSSTCSTALDRSTHVTSPDDAALPQ
jgi:hypothetical protein